MKNLLSVSPSPHVHASDSVSKIMYMVLIALLPAFLVSIYSFGLGAIITMLIAIVSCAFFEYVFQKYLLKTKNTVQDGSAILTGALLAFNVPSNLPWWQLVIGSLVAIGIAKSTFGGLGNNLFNPALVGRVFLLISYPTSMTNSWPAPLENMKEFMSYTDAVTGATPLSLLSAGLKKGLPAADVIGDMPSYLDMLFGTIAGSMGEISAIALVIGGLFLIFKKVISWHIPVAVLGSMFLFNGILWLADDVIYADPFFHLITGGAMLGAFFMATDMVTSPMSKKGMIIYGMGIGVLTVIIRVFGSYPEGISFAILIFNAFTPLINRYTKPKKFGY